LIREQSSCQCVACKLAIVVCHGAPFPATDFVLEALCIAACDG